MKKELAFSTISLAAIPQLSKAFLSPSVDSFARTYFQTVSQLDKPTRTKILLQYVEEKLAFEIDIEAEANSKIISQKSVKRTNISPERMAAVTKSRPYPLFLAEKGASLLDFTAGQNRRTSDTKTKEHLVVLGTGWGAAAFLKSIDTDKFDVTVISPRNYFVFTPMLAGASVGTVEYRSIAQPIREINSKVRYLEAAANDIDPKTNTITCTSIACEGNSCETEEFTINYDRLLFSVGAQTNTFGTPGVEEYCNFLKQVDDAHQIKNAIVNCFESAGLPGLSDEEKERELTFVVVGAGPAGIEFAAELLDFIDEDGHKFYPELLPYVRIKIVSSGPEILKPFDESMRKEAIKRLTKTISIGSSGKTLQPVEFLLNKRVSEVTERAVFCKDGTKIPYGMSVWAAGNGQLPITSNIVEALEETAQEDAQDVARGRLAVDPWLRVIGGNGKIFSLGDCSCVTTTPFLPATAQVASQQGEFLAKLLSRDYTIDITDETAALLPPMAFDPNQHKSLSEKIASKTIGDSEIAAPFQFLDLGILAYTGSGSALAQVKLTPGDTSGERKPLQLNIKGKVGFDLWRTIYLTKQTSPKNAALVALDWLKAKMFGRDISMI